MAGPRNRQGRVGATPVRLAAWRDQPYLRRVALVLPDRQDIPGAEGKIQADPERRLWHINQWDGGEGDDLWRNRARYHVSESVRPVRRGDGIELGARSTVTQHFGSPFIWGHTLGLAQGTLWAASHMPGGVVTQYVTRWDRAIAEWSDFFSVGAVSQVTIADGYDGWLYVSRDSGNIGRLAPGSSTWQTHVTAATVGWNPTASTLIDFEGILYAVAAWHLYSVNKAAQNSVTQRAAIGTRNNIWQTNTPWSYRRMARSDVGVVWTDRTNDGTTYIRQYNHFEDEYSTIGMLPVDQATPYGVYVAHGTVFVGFRYASAHDAEGEAFLYFQQGANRGVVPLRSVSGVTANKPVWLAGVIGDRLMIYYDDRVWGYDLTSGGMTHIARQVSGGTATDAKTFGKDVFLAGLGTQPDEGLVERIETERYTDAGSLDTGRFDLGYPGLTKVFTAVEVVTDPLPAGTSVNVDFAIEGGTWQTCPETHDTVGATNQSFSITEITVGPSTQPTNVVGREIEVRLILASTDPDATPTVRSVTVEAVSGADRSEWLLELDCGNPGDGDAATAHDLAALVAMARSKQVVTFEDPWGEVAEHESPTYRAVRVMRADLPEVGARSPAYATVVLREEGVT